MTVLPPTQDALLFLDVTVVFASVVSVVCLMGVPRSRLLRWFMLLAGSYPVISWNLRILATIQGAGESWTWLLPFFNGGEDGAVRLLSMNAGSSVKSEYVPIIWNFISARWLGFLGLVLLGAALMKEFRGLIKRKPRAIL
jgi:hypothetical protein